MEGCGELSSDERIMVEVTPEAVDYIREKGATEVTVMLAKSGGC